MTSAQRIIGCGDPAPGSSDDLPFPTHDVVVVPKEDVIPVPVVIATATLIVAITGAIIGLINMLAGDKDRRSRFTHEYVDRAETQLHGNNVVVIHTPHRVSGAPWQPYKVTCNLAIGSIDYVLFVSKMGNKFELTNLGDGGWINWAYYGEFVRNGGTITAVEHS